jgi:superfamily I DNA/RNA helicase
MLDIVVRQPIPKVFMGDRHQQIYGWRGAQNALALIQPTVARYLTQSFRLGPLIAALANVLLATYKGETVPLQGCRPRGEIGHLDYRRPYTVIARTNAGIFDEAAQRVQWRRPPRLHFVGGLQGYPFQRILDAWRLYAERREAIRDPFLRAFPDFATLEQLAAEVDDRELKQLCRVVRQYGQRIPTLVRQIEHHTVPDPAGAQVCLTTAHKTKGLEFDQVVLAEDFPSLVQTPLPEIDSEEVNLLYVAVTRTRDLLELNTPLREVLKAYQRQHKAN